MIFVINLNNVFKYLINRRGGNLDLDKSFKIYDSCNKWLNSNDLKSLGNEYILIIEL
jgi:hypothetical protein